MTQRSPSREGPSGSHRAPETDLRIQRGRSELSNLYRPRPKVLSRAHIVAFAILLLVLLLLADGLYVIQGMNSSLRGAVRSLEAGRTALEDGNVAGAKDHFTEARSQARTAHQLSTHPSLPLAQFIPGLTADAEVLRNLARSTTLVTEGALLALEGIVRLGGTTEEDLAATVFDGGRVRLPVLEAAAIPIEDAHDSFAEAQRMLQDLPSPVLPQLRDALVLATTEIHGAAVRSENASILLNALPALLGRDGPTRYLLAFQSPSEARGTGGIIGLYGVLEAENGEVSLTHVGPFAELFQNLDTSQVDTLTEKDELLARYGKAIAQSGQVNRSADVESVSEVLLEVYAEASGLELHGVLMTDPVALGRLLRATGPLEAPGFPEDITADNATEVLLKESYERFAGREEAQRDFLVGLIQDFYTTVGSGDLDASEFIAGFSSATTSQHLKLYASDEAIQNDLTSLGISGTFAPHLPLVQSVFHNNLGKNKVDYYLRRDIDTSVSVGRTGSLVVTNEITLENRAPSEAGPMTSSSERLVGPGVNWMELNALMPRGAKLTRWSVDGKAARPELGEDAGLSAAWLPVRIKPGATAHVSMTYEVRAAVDILRGGALEFSLFPQATVVPDSYTLTVHPPAGFRVRLPDDETNAVRSRRETVTFSGVLDRVQTVSVTIEPL